MFEQIHPGVLFTQQPMIVFYPDIDHCPFCASKLYVLKTRLKKVVTMEIGAFYAKEIILKCNCNKMVFHSKQLRSLVPAKCIFGFDIIEYIGRSLFIRCRNSLEIKQELSMKNIFISEREISYLGRKFIIYLAFVHHESRNKIKDSMKKNGGFILHFDGTCDGNSPHLFSALDSISNIVLENIKLPSEKKELLVPFFSQLKELYGSPLALVHDMGKGIMGAIEEVFPNVADFICHYHFLRDIGKDLLLEDYQFIMKSLRSHNIRTILKNKAKYLEKKINDNSEIISKFQESLENNKFNSEFIESMPIVASYVLIHWIFEAPRQSNGYGFPFDRIHLELYLRMEEVYNLLNLIVNKDQYNKKDNKPFIKLWRSLGKVITDKNLKNGIRVIQSKAKVFDKLRNALRITQQDGTEGLNDDGDDTDIKTIENEVKKFREWIVLDKYRQKQYSKMIEQIDKYWEKLFADPISVMTGGGIITISPQRTNNILERFFRCEKRKSRKRSGMASLSKALKAMLADTPLVRNLENDEYYKIILNGCSTLAERFAQIDEKMVYEKIKMSQKNQEKVLPGVSKILKKSDLTKKIEYLFV